MKKRAFLGVAAVLVLTGQAAAEGMTPPPSRIRAPGAPITVGWGGFYVGAGLGAGAVSSEISGEQKVWDYLGYWCGREHWGSHKESFREKETGDIGLFGTVTVGFDQRVREGWVAGVFADYDFGSDKSVDLALPNGDITVDHEYSWSVGARLGYLVTPSTLLYGTGGFTQASFDAGDLGSETYNGYFVGAGVETILQGNWSLKLEYRYSDYGSESISETRHLAADLDPSSHSARAVLIYKLGR